MEVYVAVGKLPALLVYLNKLIDPTLVKKRFKKKNKFFLDLVACKVEIFCLRGLALKSRGFYLHSKQNGSKFCGD